MLTTVGWSERLLHDLMGIAPSPYLAKIRKLSGSPSLLVLGTDTDAVIHMYMYRTDTYEAFS